MRAVLLGRLVCYWHARLSWARPLVCCYWHDVLVVRAGNVGCLVRPRKAHCDLHRALPPRRVFVYWLSYQHGGSAQHAQARVRDETPHPRRRAPFPAGPRSPPRSAQANTLQKACRASNNTIQNPLFVKIVQVNISCRYHLFPPVLKMSRRISENYQASTSAYFHEFAQQRVLS